MKKLFTLLVAAIVISFVTLTPGAEASQKPGGPKWLEGKLSGKLTKDMKGVQKFFNDNKDTFKLEDAEKEFLKISETEDNNGMKHFKLQQIVNGVEVWGNQYYIHFDNEGSVYLVNGNYDPDARKFKINKDIIGKNKAEGIAGREVQYEKLEMPIESKLYLYKVDNIYLPVYRVRVNFLYPEPGDWYIFVNAYDGSIVDKYNNFKTGKPSKPGGGTATTGTGRGVLGDSKTINIFGSSGSYSLIDRSEPMYARGGEVITYDCNNTYRTPGTVMTDADTTFNTSREAAGVDAHYYAGEVYNYYFTTFGRNSIDNNFMDIKSSVHYGSRYNNAGWTGSQMIYGDGDGTNYRPFSAAFDVVAHELTHGVTDYEANLVYKDQSGALNESFSDVFGVIIENRYGSGNWLMGEDCNIKAGAFRDVSNPGAYGDPDNMSKYVYTTADNGGVHTNSGIPNKAAYNAYVNLGRDFGKLEKIYYRALTTYMTQSSDFSDARLALQQSAADFYGAGSAEVNAIASAFVAVGIN